MVKVTNKTGRVVPLARWKVLPNSSKLLDARGHHQDAMPEEIAFSSTAKRLADAGLLSIEGYSLSRVKVAMKFSDTVDVKDKVVVTPDEAGEETESKPDKKKGKK